MGNNRSCHQDSDEIVDNNYHAKWNLEPDLQLPGVFIEHGTLLIPTDLMNIILQMVDRDDLMNMLHVNKEMNTFIRMTEWNDYQKKHELMYEFIMTHYASAQSMLSTIFNYEQLFDSNINNNNGDSSPHHHLQVMIDKFIQLGRMMRNDVILKCLVHDQVHVTQWQQFPQFESIFNTGTPWEDLENGTVKIIFREKRIRKSIIESLVPKESAATLFESLLDFKYEYSYNSSKRTTVENRIELYPAFLFGPYIIEMDESGICLPRFCDHSHFSDIAYRKAKHLSSKTIASFIAKWNLDQITAMKKDTLSYSPLNTKVTFLEALAKLIKLEIDPAYALLMREYAYYPAVRKSTQPFFSTKEMIYPLRASILSDEDIKEVIKSARISIDSDTFKCNLSNREKAICIKFMSHCQLDNFVHHITEKVPMLAASRVPDSSLFRNFDICFLLRYKSAGNSVVFYDDLKCIPHKNCMQLARYA